MKKRFLLLAVALIAATGVLFAQSADNEDEVIKIDRWNQNAYREGEILVKFKADGAVQMRAPRKAKFQTSQVNAVDALFEELGVDSVEQLMPRTGHKNVGRRVKAYNGKDVEVKDLSKLYRVTLKAEKAQDIHAAIERLKAQEEVEFAEPNYIVYTMALPYQEEAIPTADQQTYTAEPLYSQQWGLQAINLPALWDKPKKSTKRPVIAILDTGVDIEHPDLAANIWTNAAEASGISGQDDDANGFKDDIHGWDFINNHSVTNDFNGHGTHCAGIAAAVGNNGIGITGANPDALIMPVTVMQSNGTGDVATIVKGIDYAAANGADVISMSIGGYSYSQAEEQALGRAYANAVIVAAAGNDGHAMVAPNHCMFDAPMFPAALSFVLGVEASANAVGSLAGFSNYDESGPIYSPFGEEKLYNYELRAPGVGIMSTFPGGRYKSLNGTSMACPLVAGAVSRLLQCKETLSWELLFGDLIHTRVVGGLGNVNILGVYNIKEADRKPELSLVSINLIDSVSGDGDFRADAGETIEFYPIFKNAWGQAENIRFWIKTGHYSGTDWVADDETLITHLQESVDFGKPISSYAKATSANPWRMKVNPDCADGRQINLTLFATCDNMQGTLTQHIVLTVENGVEIGGMLTEDLTLYPNVHYIVTRPLAVPNGVTLTIKPGTVVKFKDGTGLSVNVSEMTLGKYKFVTGVTSGIFYPDTTKSTQGHLIANGTPDSLIWFTRADGEQGNFTLSLGVRMPYSIRTYTINNVGQQELTFYDTIPVYDSQKISYIRISEMHYSGYSGPVWNAYMKNCIITNSSVYNMGGAHMEKCAFMNNKETYSMLNTYTYSIINTNYANSKTINLEELTLKQPHQKLNNIIPTILDSKNSKYNNTRFALYCEDKVPSVRPLQPNYYGASKENEVRKYIYDIEHDCGFGYFDLSNMLTRPSSEAHGIVWKILVDGIDAQDEFELLPPIGVGQHRCDVYFNRPMDVSISPTVSFGVRQPYTQHQVAENGSWSADSTIYTAYFTIDGKSVSDGLNTFKVYGAEDNEHFEIPEENFRFHMEVAAAGSMSTGLMAEAGLGKVTLTWETDEEDFADLLGYNIYRWTQDTIKWNRYWDSQKQQYIEAGWRFDTICVNSTLLDAQDTEFVDYNVVPGKDYYYVIRQVTTSLNSYDLSNAVVARPLTAVKGDANGSMSVDVADVVTEVAYLTNQNPQPFIFEAADVNTDNTVNILDVVGTINIITHPELNTGAATNETATFYLENGILYVESDVVLGGVQVTLAADPETMDVHVLEALQGFENVGVWTGENNYMFMAYSMSGKTIGVGKTALLQIGNAELTSIILSDGQGHNVPASPRVGTDCNGERVHPGIYKLLQNNNVYIQYGEHRYNMLGIEVK
ncbi:MAG: S8 family serine peptidase [Paludibacteraceae bacterium]|nr:S8 family serine peptidase [Paludibacteraceae bacterium]